MTYLRSVLLVSSVFLLCALPAHAQTTIPVANPSFETVGTLLPGNYNFGPIPGWTVSGVAGSWQPPTSRYATLPDGVTVAYSNGGTITQDLGVPAQPNTTYTLTVYVGHRSDGYVANYTIMLSAGTANFCITTGSNSSIPAGTFAKQTLSCPSGASPTGNLNISLSSSGPQVDFDDVILTSPATVPPDPISITVDIAALQWCTKCDGSDYTPMTGNLVIQQTGGPVSSFGINSDGSVQASGTVDLSQDPLEFTFSITDANNVTLPGESFTWKLPKFAINLALQPYPVTVGIVRFTHITIPFGGDMGEGSTCQEQAGCPAVQYVSGSFGLGK